MKLRSIIRYLEIIDRQLEILYINFSRKLSQYPQFALFWKDLSLEKGNLHSCLFLIEQVGEENLSLTEYHEDEFICAMEKLTHFIKKSTQAALNIEECIETAVQIETEHYAKIFNHLTRLVSGDFKKVVREMDHNKEYRNKLKRLIIEHYPENTKKKELIQQIEKSLSS
ncbi:MAG TPA: hypothetical protein DHW82_05380 [Spirochaetia bacterium]|nr:MAG: hypothetical protein A2Y41_00960 [Spirochaetes bacterium GWB1_36_13]HCL56424.1 hypothetical protein [Spirochaetia bacterium]